MNKTVRFEVDLNNLAPLSAARQADLKDLAQMPDSRIDYSDQPALDAKVWQNAVRNPLYRPTKTSTTVRVDSDVLAWLKGQGSGYQTRLNGILRDAMLRSIDRKG